MKFYKEYASNCLGERYDIIEISSLEELLELSTEEGKELIIRCPWQYGKFEENKDRNIPTIIVYDDYIE